MESPHNARGWDRLADAYQRELGWPDDDLTWGMRCPPEAELGLITDVVTDADTLVVGCGGGQDLVALHRLGAGTLTGVDPSQRQLFHATERCRAAGIEVTLLRTGAEDLSALPEAGYDLAVSVHALNYVPNLTTAVRQIRRVLRPEGVLALSVMHPADASTADTPPYAWERSWFEVQQDWVWDGLAEDDIPFRSWFPSPSAWFTVLTEGGFRVERLLEPQPVEDRRWIDRGWLDTDSYAKLAVLPGTILMRARREADG